MAANRSYRYGYGLFETMKVRDERILLFPLHAERLLSGLEFLKIPRPAFFTPEKLEAEITGLCRKNACGQGARVRLSVSAGEGGLYDHGGGLQYVIEAWPLEEAVNSLNENGLHLGVFTGARKGCDDFSNLKSASFLPYAMAAAYARENRLNDCLLLNNHDRVADSTMANLFIVSRGKIFTPPLSEGCVAGVMRRHLLNHLPEWGYPVTETPLETRDIESAEEVFLTNAIRGIRWVGRFGEKIYSSRISGEIYNRLP